MIHYIDIVLKESEQPSQGAPEHIFVEVENDQRQSIRLGEWVHRNDGYEVIRVTKDDFEKLFNLSDQHISELEHPISYLEAELDSLKSAYKETGEAVYSQGVLETKKALRILKNKSLKSDVDNRRGLIKNIEQLYPPDGHNIGAHIVVQSLMRCWRKMPTFFLEALRTECINQDRLNALDRGQS